MSVSATTRPMRPGERDGVDYHFVGDAEFERDDRGGRVRRMGDGVRPSLRNAQGSRSRQRSRSGRDILFDIDWQGARQLEPDFGEHLVTIFLLPPSMAELERRLRARGTDSEEVIAERMRRAADEISHWAEYEYVLVNRDMDACLGEVRAIVAAERLKREPADRSDGLCPGPRQRTRDLLAKQFQESCRGEEVAPAARPSPLRLRRPRPISRAASARRR